MLDLHYQRVMSGLSMEQLAKKCGVTRQAIYLIEHGENNPSPKLAKNLGKALNVNWWEFFED